MSDNFYPILTIPHLRVQNANALSSPFTIGFPAVTAWLGAVHALQRKLNQTAWPDLRFTGVAIINHNTQLHSYRGAGDFVSSIIGTANPAKRNGTRPAFIEEPRCHLDASLSIHTKGMNADNEAEILSSVQKILLGSLKIAGGDILECGQPKFTLVDPNNPSEIRSLMHQLMPGHILLDRRDLMVDAMQSGQDAASALLDYLTVKHRSQEVLDDTGESETIWTSRRKVGGWIVPIATGFQGLSELGRAANQRDPCTPHRFAESIVTLGEFKMVYRMKSIEELFWRYEYLKDESLYICKQSQPNSQETSND